MKRHWRRKNYFIKKELQGKYIFNFFIFVVAGTIIFSLIFSLFTSDTLTIIYEKYNLKLGKTPLILIKETLLSHWLFVFTVGIGIVIISMFLTHRFAGPIYRFEKSLEEMNKGNFNFVVRLRRKDEAKELAALMNKLIETISSNLYEMRQISNEIQTNLLDTHELLKKIEAPEEAVTHLNSASNSMKKLKDMLYRFQIKDNE